MDIDPSGAPRIGVGYKWKAAAAIRARLRVRAGSAPRWGRSGSAALTIGGTCRQKQQDGQGGVPATGQGSARPVAAAAHAGAMGSVNTNYWKPALAIRTSSVAFLAVLT